MPDELSAAAGQSVKSGLEGHELVQSTEKGDASK